MTLPSAREAAIHAAVAGVKQTASTQSMHLDSWRRCLEVHRLSPVQSRLPRVVTAAELRAHREELEPHRQLLERGLFELFSFLGPVGYDVTFCSRAGITILTIPDAVSGLNPHLECLGSLWTEDQEGTNGIGTCLWEERPVSIYGDEHFISCHTSNNCGAVPVRGPGGQIMGVMNSTISTQAVSRETHAVAFGVMQRIGEAIERRLFREHFKECVLLELRVAPDRLGTVAVRDEGTLVAADAGAHAMLGTTGAGVSGLKLWQFFDRDAALFRPPAGDHESALVLSSTGATIRVRSTMPATPRSLATTQASRASRMSAPVRLPERANVLTLEEAAGQDHRMQEHLRLLERTRDTPLAVLLLGETGTGKDVMARAIHAASARARGPYVAINCAAIPETLIDSELFGYAGGAFTGARRDGSAGRVAEAHGGTLFLDEIGDMPLSLQTRLLRLIETSEVAPLGGGSARVVDIRVIAATNVAIARAMADGRFRSDLYYRLCGVVVELPPLRDRTDFAMLVASMLLRETGDSRLRVAPETMRLLRSHSWPGNIRELRSVLVRAICLSGGGDILPEHVTFGPAGATPAATASSPVWAAERDAIVATLERCQWNMANAAATMGMSRATLYRRLKDMGIARPRRS